MIPSASFATWNYFDRFVDVTMLARNVIGFPLMPLWGTVTDDLDHCEKTGDLLGCELERCFPTGDESSWKSGRSRHGASVLIRDPLR